MTAYSGQKAPARFNLARYCLQDSARQHRDKTALIVARHPSDPTEDEVWSYGELEDAVLSLAAGLKKMALNRGDRILIRLPNTSDYALLFFGAIAAGYVPIPASDQLSPREIRFLFEDSQAAAIAVPDGSALPKGLEAPVIISSRDVEEMRNSEGGDYADTGADDPAFLIYTSGTSGTPKGVLHAQRSAWGRRPMYQGWYGIGPGDTMVHAGSFNWTYTLGVGMSDPWANGATAVLFTGEKEPAVWPALIERVEGTIFAGVPSLYRRILKYTALSPQAMPTLRHGLVAGEPLPHSVARQWHERTGRRLFEALGMSEISTYISTAPTMPIREGSPGVVQQGRAVAILPVDEGTTPLPVGETGLLAVHRTDPGLMLRYWDRPEDTRAAFRGDWFCGGDLASFDEDGYLWFEGRADDVMNAMGYRVAPAEVEAVLSTHPAVAECAVTEIRVREDLSIIMGFVVAKPDHPVTADELIQHTAASLAAYKCPREIMLVDDLPRTANGKLRRKALSNLVSESKTADTAT